MKRTKLLALFLALALIVGALAGCSSGNNTDDKSTNDPSSSNEPSSSDNAGSGGGTTLDDKGWRKLAVGSSTTAQSFSPVSGSWSAEYNVCTMIYETLGSYDENMELVGIVAKDWKKVDEDGFIYDVEIYDYVEDIDGNKIDADDIMACIDNGFEDKYTFVTRYVDHAEKTGDYSIRVYLVSNTSDAFSSWFTTMKIYDQDAYQASGDKFATRPIGTTHYRLVSFEPGGNVVVKRDDHKYWQTDASLIKAVEQRDTVDEVELIGYSEASQQSIATETGNVDLFLAMNGAVVSRFEDDSAYNVFAHTKTMSRGLYFSGEPGMPTADNLALRQAIAYAIDVDGLIAIVHQGRAVREKSYTSELTVGFQQKWLDEDWYEYDVEKAKEKLAEAGYKEGELTLTFLTLAEDEWQKVAQAVQNYLGAIGINVEINAFEGALYGATMNDGTQYDITLDSIGGNFYATNVNSKMGQSGYGGKTKTGFVDDKLEELIYNCRFDDATDADFDALHNYLRDTCYMLPLYDSIEMNVWKADSGIVELAYDYKAMNVLNATVFK